MAEQFKSDDNPPGTLDELKMCVQRQVPAKERCKAALTALGRLLRADGCRLLGAAEIQARAQARLDRAGGAAAAGAAGGVVAAGGGAADGGLDGMSSEELDP